MCVCPPVYGLVTHSGQLVFLDTTHVHLSTCLWAGYSQWAGSALDTTCVGLSSCLWAGYSKWAGSVWDTTHVRLSTCLWAGYSQWAGSVFGHDTRASVHLSMGWLLTVGR